MGKTQVYVHNIKCSKCGKVHNPEITKAGNHVGNGQILAKAIMEYKYNSLPANQHPLSTGKGKNKCAEAHHLICSESMDDDEWAEICSIFGYDINCKENGILLPSVLSICCQLHIPLHKGNHSQTDTQIIGLTYVDAVKGLIDSVMKKAKRKGYCEESENKTIISDLNSKSKQIWQNVRSFAWTISKDGQDYISGGVGCSGVNTIGAKNGKPCPSGRNHNLTILPQTYFLEQE